MIHQGCQSVGSATIRHTLAETANTNPISTKYHSNYCTARVLAGKSLIIRLLSYFKTHSIVSYYNIDPHTSYLILALKN